MQKPFLPVLHALRGIAALWVVVFHIWHTGLLPIDSPLIIKAYLWVDFFFLLSGFIIAYHYQELFTKPAHKQQTLAFVAIRAARIFPMHLFVLVLWIGIELLQLYYQGKGFDKDRQWVTLLPNALLIQSWLFHDSSWNPPSWSISCEWFFYVTFPILALALAKRSLRFSLMVIALMIGTLFLAANYFQLLRPDKLELTLGLTSNGGLFRAVPEFVIGILLYNIITRHSAWLKQYGKWIFWIASFGTLSSVLYYNNDFLIVAGFILMVFGGTGIEGKGFRSFNFAGDISYSVYILHSVIIAIAAHVFAPSLSAIEALAVTGGLLLLTLGCSAATYRFIEKPCHLWAKRRFREQL